jgi:hypothetical protein
MFANRAYKTSLSGAMQTANTDVFIKIRKVVDRGKICYLLSALTPANINAKSTVIDPLYGETDLTLKRLILICYALVTAVSVM